ncbi:MAG: chorismate synthase [Fidelibacterota bacterium]
MNYLTAGESHGRGLVGILEGIPANLDISLSDINTQLSRRQKGFGRSKRMKIEQDQVEIWSGVRHGKTLGSPIGMTITNKDWENWSKEMAIESLADPPTKITIPRPGHADLAGIQKFGFDDTRNVLERSSARETTMRVALASVSRKMLQEVGITVGSRVIQILTAVDRTPLPAEFDADDISRKADASPVRCLNSAVETEMVKAIGMAEKQGDSAGGVFEVMATGLPYGLGSYTQWNRKLNTRIAAAMMSINAFKGLEIGLGFKLAENPGSTVHDAILWEEGKYTRPTNNAGGIEGGMSNGQPIVLRMVMKPIPTLRKPLDSVDIHTKLKVKAHRERADVCAVPAASVIAESMLCFVLADALLEKFGGDSMDQLKGHMAYSAKY